MVAFICGNMRTINFNIQQDTIQIRDFLRNFGVSASLLTKLKQTENGIMKNGEFAKTIESVTFGDVLQINIENKGTMPTPTDLDVEICYEDDDIIVVNKPPFMPVHESRNHRGDTVSNFIAYHTNSENDTAFRAVYRLDRDTSGLVLIAKHELSASKLAGKIDKNYYAVVSGILENDFTINKPIARCGESIIKRQVDDDGEMAITHCHIVSHKNGNTLLKINLETGRTHQIRVHLSYLGYPLLGDTLYGGNKDLINRQALHCKTISFIHPITNKKMTIDSDFSLDIKEVI